VRRRHTVAPRDNAPGYREAGSLAPTANDGADYLRAVEEDVGAGLSMAGVGAGRVGHTAAESLPWRANPLAPSVPPSNFHYMRERVNILFREFVFVAVFTNCSLPSPIPFASLYCPNEKKLS
jgi:hypothetical protein